MENEFKAVDLFAGAGGFSLAAKNLEVDVLAAVELNNDACDSYNNNLFEENNPTKLFNQDILELAPSDLLEKIGLKKGELDLLMGGPPCQGFSSHRINDAGVDDPRNNLLIRYFDFVKEIEPKLFLVENVPGMLWKRHELYLQKFKNLSRRNGYKLLGPVKINAKDFGVPQNRQRIFILGVRTDIDTSSLSWPPEPTHGAPGGSLPEWLSASVAFEKPPENIQKELINKLGEKNASSLEWGTKISAHNADNSALHMNHTPALIDRFASTPINGGRMDNSFRLPCHSEGYDGHLDVYGRIRLGQPGPTITTGCFNPSKGRFLHPWKNHGITVRHAARLQTFPDDFVFSGGITSQGAQVGNAVPVLLAQIMIKASIECLKALDQEERQTA